MSNVPCPIRTGVAGAGFEAASGNAFASNADGTLTVIHQDSPDQHHVVEGAQTPQSSRNMGLDSSNHCLFIVSAKSKATPAGERTGAARDIYPDGNRAESVNALSVKAPGRLRPSAGISMRRRLRNSSGIPRGTGLCGPF